MVRTCSFASATRLMPLCLTAECVQQGKPKKGSKQRSKAVPEPALECIPVETVSRAGASAAAAAALSAGLSPRFALSCTQCTEALASLRAEVQAAAMQSVHFARSLSRAAAKDCDAAAEAWSVCSDQLLMCVAALELAVDEGVANEDGVAIISLIATALLCHQGAEDAVLFLTLPLFPSALPALIDWTARVRDGVEPALTDVSGCGAFCYASVGSEENALCLTIRDSEGEEVQCVAPADVCVCLGDGCVRDGSVCVGEGCVRDGSVCVGDGVVTSVAVLRPGTVEVRYAVPEGRLDPVSLTVSAFGCPLRRTPFTINVRCAHVCLLSSTLFECYYRCALYLCVCKLLM